jgi:ribosomal-protein-alanine N-acetyltransferase
VILNIRAMKDSDIDSVYTMETDLYSTPWSIDTIRSCVLVGYDCRVLEMSHCSDHSERYDPLQIKNGNNPIVAGYIISRLAENICHILNFCIATSLQSKGFGRKLLQTVLDSVSKHPHINTVVLEVRASNGTAIHLYTTMGFEQVEIKKNYYNDYPVEDAIILKKKLEKGVDQR